MTPAVVPQEAMHHDEELVQRGGNAALDPPVQAGFVSGAAALAALAGVDSESGADRSNGVPESDDSASEQATSTDEKTHAVEEVEKADAIDAPAEKNEATPNGEPDESDASSKLAEMKISNEDVHPDEEHDEQHEEMRNSSAAALPEETDSRQHLNVVFIGHVDAGKSTIGGQILYLSDMVDERTIQKYEREAKDKNRESWYMAYIMDTNEEERAKGKTVEVGRAHFETAKTRFTILDAPGHKNYVPNMISGASQADVGVLVIAARKGEFETGFERGGQTREHAQLAKTLGVSKLLVVVNKMDDPSVEWSKERFDEIEKKIVPFLKTCGYNTKKDVQFLPISGLYGHNMKERMSKSICPWWDGPCLFEALDTVELPERNPAGPFRMPLIDKYRDMGTVVMGKIESGSVRRGDTLILMPNKALVKVVTVYRDNDEVTYAKPGENLRLRLSGIEEEDISQGFVLSAVNKPIPAVLEFDAQLQILELLDHKAIFTAGYKAVLHIHSVVEECEIMGLLHQIDPKTKKPMKKKILFVKSGAVVVVRIQVNELICVEKFEDFPQLGRFTLRDEGKTVAIGKIVSFPKSGTSSQN
jgi:peptide chain release factor subunit 3